MKSKLDKFSLEKVALSALGCDILNLMLKEGYPLNQEFISNKTGATISGVSKALSLLEEYGLIISLKQEIWAYIINPFRKREIKKFLSGRDLGKNKPYVLSCHADTYEAELNDLPDKLAKKLEQDPLFSSYRPKNWRAYKTNTVDGSFKFHRTNKKCKIIAYFRTFGFNPATIEQVNNEKFYELKKELEDKIYGLKIGNPECVAVCPWKEYALLKDPIAVAGIALGIKHKKIEQSYGYPEWEEKGHDAREKIQKIIDLRDKVTGECTPKEDCL